MEFGLRSSMDSSRWRFEGVFYGRNVGLREEDIKEWTQVNIDSNELSSDLSDSDHYEL